MKDKKVNKLVFNVIYVLIYNYVCKNDIIDKKHGWNDNITEK